MKSEENKSSPKINVTNTLTSQNQNQSLNLTPQNILQPANLTLNSTTANKSLAIQNVQSSPSMQVLTGSTVFQGTSAPSNNALGATGTLTSVSKNEFKSFSTDFNHNPIIEDTPIIEQSKSQQQIQIQSQSKSKSQIEIGNTNNPIIAINPRKKKWWQRLFSWGKKD
jgi:hypothetical protein